MEERQEVIFVVGSPCEIHPRMHHFLQHPDFIWILVPLFLAASRCWLEPQQPLRKAQGWRPVRQTEPSSQLPSALALLSHL